MGRTLIADGGKILWQVSVLTRRYRAERLWERLALLTRIGPETCFRRTVWLLTFIAAHPMFRANLSHLAEKILRPKPLSFGADYPPPLSRVSALPSQMRSSKQLFHGHTARSCKHS